MSDAASLRKVLQRTDPTAPAIQGAAGAMMKHYDKSPVVAVNEWRQALHQGRPDQFLPLLYVANEVLQNSKRNRGNKFLEAFSPVLGQALIFISQNSPASAVEKVRRTVKIWGDRHVFSIRYVNELLKGLDPYRDGSGGDRTAVKAAVPASPGSPGGAGFSPVATNNKSHPASPATKSKPTLQKKEDFDREMAMDLHDDGYSGGDKGADDDGSNSEDDDGADDDDDDDDLFGNASSSLLKIDVDLDRAAVVTASAVHSNKKRRRSNDVDGATSIGYSSPTHKQSKRRSILSTNSLMELWNQVSSQQTSYDLVQGSLKELNNPEYLDEGSINQQIDTLVGDELLQEYKKVIQNEKKIAHARRELYYIAQRRRGLEMEAIRYLPWLETSLKQDQDDIEFCDKYRRQLELFAHVHKPAKVARDGRIQEETQRRRREEELRRKREEEEERKRFMESAMSKQTEAKPGMVWNKATGEYQYLNQDEDWRD
jgi:hypothetical protein